MEIHNTKIYAVILVTDADTVWKYPELAPFPPPRTSERMLTKIPTHRENVGFCLEVLHGRLDLPIEMPGPGDLAGDRR